MFWKTCLEVLTAWKVCALEVSVWKLCVLENKTKSFGKHAKESFMLETFMSWKS